MSGDLLVVGASIGLLYGLVASGYALLWSTMSLLHFAHGEFVTLGAFVGLTVVGVTDVGRWPLAVLGAVGLVVGIFGILVERGIYSRIPRHSFTTRILVTVGVGEALRAACALVWGARTHALPDIFGGTPLHVFGFTIMPAYAWILGVSLAIDLLLILVMFKTKLGLGLRAVSFAPEIAETLGVNSRAMYTIAFLVGGAVAGMTGVLIAPITFVNYTLGLSIGVKGFAAAVVGGLGDFTGAMVGGLVVGLVEALGSWFAPGYKDIIVFGVLIIVIVARPNGLFGRAVAEKV